MSTPSIEQVLKYSKPCTEYQCPISANTYGIEFTRFSIRDVDRKVTLFEVAKPDNVPEELELMDDRARFIRYEFSPGFLRLQTIGTTLTFRVGSYEIKDFRMIERHYFRDELIRSYDFTAPFCVPNSTNTWELVYKLPDLTAATMKEMEENPNETRSDSFYFVKGKMVMHNRAEYSFTSKK